MLDERDQDERRERQYYQAMIAPRLPPAVLDFHTHAWRRDQWIQQPGSPAGAAPPATSADAGLQGAQQYMVTEAEYPMERLQADGRVIFTGRDYHAVVFGQPTPAVDLDLTNHHVAESARRAGFYPLMVAGRGIPPAEELRRQIIEGGFYGIKVFLNWVGDDYGSVTVEEMIGPVELALADELGLIVLLHVPRARRLADPEVQRGVRHYAQRWTNVRFVLAHCGRCYLYDEMKQAIGSVADLENVFMDTSMVMDPMALQLVFKHLDSRRVLFATDFPVAAMRGRRVRVMDHWVDVVLEGYPASHYRAASNRIHAGFMAWEIVRAVAEAGEMAGLSGEQIRAIFYDNGMAVLGHVRGGQLLETHHKGILQFPGT